MANCNQGKRLTSPPQKSFRARPVEQFFYVYGISGPIPGATITLKYYYDEATGNFLPITFNLCNPGLPMSVTTDNNGKASICVLQGTWQIQVSANGYYTNTITKTFIYSEYTEVELTEIPLQPLPTPQPSIKPYIYVGYYMSPSPLDQVDPSTMTLVNTVNTDYIIYSLTFDGKYIYAGTFYQVIQIDPYTLKLVKGYSPPTNYIQATALTFDGTYIYAAYAQYHVDGYRSPGMVAQIDPSTMTAVKIYNAPSSKQTTQALTFDGKYIYVGYSQTPAYVDQIDPSTMTVVNTYKPPFKGYGVLSLTTDGTYVYVGYACTPGTVDKIDPSTMTLVKTYRSPNSGYEVYALTFDGTYIYAGYWSNPSLEKIDPSTMTFVSLYAPQGRGGVTSLTFDGKYVYAGYSQSPGIVDQIDPSTLTLVKEFKAPSGHNNTWRLTQNVIKGENYAVFK
jgi:hypothetical protein